MLVHCSQGVSRSVALAVAYLMWKLDKSYYDVFEAVKAIRGVASPNIGFGCQVRPGFRAADPATEVCSLPLATGRCVPRCSAPRCRCRESVHGDEGSSWGLLSCVTSVWPASLAVAGCAGSRGVCQHPVPGCCRLVID